jgi:hypothetical protein
MAGTINYNRPKSALVNVAPMVHTLLVSELPDAPAAVGGTGTTGVLSAEIQVDADEAGGADIQTMYTLVATPTITSDGKHTLTVVVTPVGGDGTTLPAQTLAVLHPETVDGWQSAAGNGRLP